MRLNFLRLVLVALVLALLVSDASACDGPFRRMAAKRPGILIPKRSAAPAYQSCTSVTPQSSYTAPVVAAGYYGLPAAPSCSGGTCPLPR